MAQRKSELEIAMGCMTFGEEGKPTVRMHDIDAVKSVIDCFQSHGHNILDTARMYGAGTSEEYLGKLGVQSKGFKIHTKVAPNANPRITHSPEDLRTHLQNALDALKVDSVDLFYLHAPDRSTPYEETLKAVNDLYKEGKFRYFGISNYAAWEVAEIYNTCKHNGWITPSVYQGVYFGIQRTIETELIPCLRKYGIAFYAYNPLGGGLLTGKYAGGTESDAANSRFDPSTAQGAMYRKRYWNDQTFKAVNTITQAAKKEGLTVPETALRWISHHSMLKKEYNDAVLIGASSLNHIEQNLLDFEKGPLPKSVVDAYDEAWEIVKPGSPTYWR